MTGIPIPAPENRPAHALLSASGSKIWLACTPSARAQEAFEDEDSVYSREGSFAHELAAALLDVHLSDFGEAQAAWLGLVRDSADADEFHTPDLQAHVDAYVARCLEAIREARQRCPGAIVLMEQTLDFSDWVPAGFGTGDLVIVTDDVLEVRDLKFGKGVRVDAEDNTQMRMYAAGALARFGHLYGFSRVRATIDQPRLDHLDSEEYDRADLQEWMDDYVKPRAQLAWNGEGEFVAGDHCGFCRARHTCRARAEYNMKTVEAYDPDADFAVRAPTMNDEELAALLPRLDAFVKWAGDLQEWALREAVRGRRTFPDLKLVQGRSVRVITNQDALVDRLTEAGFDERLLYERTLLGLTALEKLVGKKKFEALAGGQLDPLTGEQAAPPLISKPPGKPKLVPASDPRPAWVAEDSADQDFGSLS